MQPLSEAEFTASERGDLPGAELIAHGVWSIPLPMPLESAPYFSFAYLLADSNGGFLLVDPGWDSDDNLQRIADALARAGATLDELRTIVVTHLHPDHLGLAERLRAASGAVVALHREEQEAIDAGASARSQLPPHALEAWGVPDDRLEELAAVGGAPTTIPSFSADVLLEHGQLLETPGRDIRVLWTPGHTAGHLCLRDEGAGLLFTGDHVLPAMFPGIGLGGRTQTEPIASYLRSLTELGRFDSDQVCPGHGYRFTGLADRIETTREHLSQRTHQIAEAALAHPGATVWQIASEIHWTAGFANLSGFSLLSALAQTQMHLEFIAGGGDSGV